MQPKKGFALLRAFALGAMLLAHAAAASAADSISLRWDQLPSALANKTIQVKSKSGTSVRGRFASVDEQQIHVDTRKGAKTVNRTDINGLRIIDTKRHRGRAIGTGVAAGLVVPGVAIADGSAGAKAAGVPVYIGLGYFLGWLADRSAGTDVRFVQ